MNQVNHTQSTCEELDLARDPQWIWFVWGPPILLIAVGTIVANIPGWPLVAAGLIWSVGIAWLGMSCLRNALRCGRFHCSVLGLLYPVLAFVAVGITFGWVPLRWNPFWALLFLPVTVVAFIPEFFGLKYIGPNARKSD